MTKNDVRVCQYTYFDVDGAVSERFQIEVGDTVIENLSREELKLVKDSIESALIYGNTMTKKSISDSKAEED